MADALLNYHPVQPQILDPEVSRHPAAHRIDIQPAHAMAVPQPFGAPVGALPAPKSKSFFAAHKFALIVSTIVLLVVIVVMYMYLTRRGDKKKKQRTPDGAPGPPPDSKGELEELKRLREMRRQSKEAMAAGRSPSAPVPPPVPTRAAAQHAPPQQGPQPPGRVVGVTISRTQQVTTASARPPRQAPRPPAGRADQAPADAPAPQPESAPRPESAPQSESAPQPGSAPQPESAPQHESAPREVTPPVGTDAGMDALIDSLRDEETPTMDSSQPP